MISVSIMIARLGSRQEVINDIEETTQPTAAKTPATRTIDKNAKRRRRSGVVDGDRRDEDGAAIFVNNVKREKELLRVVEVIATSLCLIQD
jgi:hypothetical protein